VHEIAPGIWLWQRRPRGLRPGEFGARTSYALTAGGETLLVDPLDSERRRRWWRERYLPTLESLAALEPQHVLVTHGEPVLGEGAAALRRALGRDPWQRPKR